MHFKEVKGIVSAQNSMNVYRGCTHGCIYCDSRSNCYQIEHDFEDIEVKSNAVELLETKLKSKRKKCMIATGSMTDPYIHLEEDIMNTRKCLEVIEKYGFGVSMITKSNRILRDLDILKRINEKTKSVVQITLTTYDENLCKILEPNVSTTSERVKVLKIMRDNNIPTIVWLGPFLPFINDTEENIRGLLGYCKEANVTGIVCFGIGLTLREGNREYFYQQLDKSFPGLKEKYQDKYREKYIVTSPNNNRLMNIIYAECKNNNIICNNNELFKFVSEFPEKDVQLDLFDR